MALTKNMPDDFYFPFFSQLLFDFLTYTNFFQRSYFKVCFLYHICTLMCVYVHLGPFPDGIKMCTFRAPVVVNGGSGYFVLKAGGGWGGLTGDCGASFGFTADFGW